MLEAESLILRTFMHSYGKAYGSCKEIKEPENSTLLDCESINYNLQFLIMLFWLIFSASYISSMTRHSQGLPSIDQEIDVRW